MPPSSDSPRWRASADPSASHATSCTLPASPTSANSATLRGSSDTSSLQAVSQPVPECFHLAMEGEDFPAMIAPCDEHPGMNRRTVFGMKRSTGRAQKGNDPFNYEIKYPEDQPYKEMAEDSRFWKTCVDEAAKIDAGKVADWTDALDVLLVFAGLFSGVVSTFVCQTFQNLQVDPTELVYIVMDELLNIQRAIDEHGPGSSKHVPRSDTSFHASRTSVWVNTLWFVSLTLSLTTALIAVVTKQWIHQYMDSAQLGTPRARARLRQFRFIQLEAWHVPAIIGLLPVLMHVALGVFFSGLIIHIRSLNTPAAAVVGLIVFFALLAYVGTSLFPVYDPACPYKTPLSAYAYIVFHRTRNFWYSTLPTTLISWSRVLASFANIILRRWTDHAVPIELPPSSEVKLVPADDDGSIVVPFSLMAAEEAIASHVSDSLDAHVAAWAYTISSNPSVRNIVLQAISNLPLHVVPIIKQRIGGKALENALNDVLGSAEYGDPCRQPAFERLLRSIYRLFPTTNLKPTVIQPARRCEGSLSVLLDICKSDGAAEFIGGQILNPSKTYDAAIWAQLLANAFYSDSAWLEGGIFSEGSVVFQTFIRWFCRPHTCALCKRHAVYTSETCQGCDLTVLHNGQSSTSPDEPLFLQTAVIDFLQPSLCHLLLHMVYRSSSSSEQSDLPSDIRLRLALIQKEWILRTSHALDEDNSSAVANLITVISGSVGIDTPDYSHLHHNAVFSATFRALKSVITETFETDILSLRDRQRLLHPFFRSLAASKDLAQEYLTWITEPIANRIIEAVFMGPIPLSGVLPLISDILSSVVHVECRILLPKLCIQLCKCGWLAVAAPMYFGRVSAVLLARRSYSFAAAAFVEALHVLKRHAHPTYNDVLEYTQDASNLLVLCQILLSSDTKRQLKLGRLVSLVTPLMWSACLQDLETFIRNDGDADATYLDLQADPAHPHEDGREVFYRPIAELLPLLADFSRHVRTHRHDCGCTWSIREADVALPATRIVRWRNFWLFGSRPDPLVQDGTAMV